MPLAPVPDLEQELDRLFGLPLEEFTRARNDLVTRLRRAHQADAAETVRALKKPTVAAWAANRLAREEAKRVEALLAAGDRLRAAQEGALSGRADAGEVGEAAAAERQAIRELLAEARAHLAGQARPATLERLAQTLRAAAVDPVGRELLSRGRLTEELRPAGFGALAGVVTPRPARRRDDVARAARRRVAELREQARRLDREARDAEAAARRADESARILAEEAAQKRRDAERAADELSEAEDALRGRR